ncbi:MAG: hypothetical protein IT422_10095 [Pirellulaceae bacterium]|nr:hypothetical protein [Pirellulaceae bacterium]
MHRIIPTTGLFIVGFALTATSAFAQYYGHYGYGHVQHEHHAHYNHGLQHGGHTYYNHYHGGYHVPDNLTNLVQPPACGYASPIYGEPVYVDSIGSDYGCPNSGYCPQAANSFGQQDVPVPLHSQQDGFAYGPTHGMNDPSHDGHDHSGHNHAGHSHSNLGNAYGPPSDPQDRNYVPAPSSLDQFPQFQLAPQQEPNSNSGIRPSSPNSSPSLPKRSEAPIRMDGRAIDMSKAILFLAAKSRSQQS